MTPDPATDPAAILARWREAEQAATEGPWTTQRAVIAGIGGAYVIEHGEAEIALVDCAGDLRLEQELADAEFIVTARTAMPRLVAAVEAVLKLAGEWDVPGEILNDDMGDPNAPARECAEALREAIRAALAGEEAGDGR